MKKYIVVSLSVLGMNNCLFHSGAEVMENAFPEGHADNLVQEGHLRLIEELGESEISDPNTGGESDSEGQGEGGGEVNPPAPGKVKARKGQEK